MRKLGKHEKRHHERALKDEEDFDKDEASMPDKGNTEGRWRVSVGWVSAHDPGLSASLPDPPPMPPLPDPSPALSGHTAEVWPFKGGVELWDPKSLRFLAQRTNSQIPELGCHGKDSV